MSNRDFTRNKKMPFKNIVYYNLNKKRLTSKIEIVEFNEIINYADISSPVVLKQKEKLNANIYKEMQAVNLQDFYNNYKDEVKLFKGYFYLLLMVAILKYLIQTQPELITIVQKITIL